jgi:hypothetical protein
VGALCVWMCGTEYGGGEGGKRRDLRDNHLTGPLPAELGELVELRLLCVQPTPLLACNVGSAAHSMGEQVVRGRECSRRRRLAGVSAVRVDLWH